MFKRSDFPSDFIFGVSTSSYQIEGNKNGICGKNHWDTFSKKPGAVYKGQDGAYACDHYHRYKEDIDLIKGAGFDAYHFSFSWPRILPNKDKKINEEGIAFYDRLIDYMLEKGVMPSATLYHWDLPDYHDEAGGWCNQDTTKYFADFSAIVGSHFGDRLHSITTVNEPWCISWLSHYLGIHAPGKKDIKSAALSMHNILLAHGRGLEALHGVGLSNVGIVLNMEYSTPYDSSEESKVAAKTFDGIYNRWFSEAVFKSSYPEDILEIFGPYMPQNYEEDLSLIGKKIDWLGINYYTRSVIKKDENEPHVGYSMERGNLPKTDMGWEVYPEGLEFFVDKVSREYSKDTPIYITENGLANKDVLNSNKEVEDEFRIDYYKKHIEALKRSIDKGALVKGYFAWSLLDNFEWSFGYSKRFGLVYVDFETQTRTKKRSYYAFKESLSR